jgi:hypothetical protein
MKTGNLEEEAVTTTEALARLLDHLKIMNAAGLFHARGSEIKGRYVFALGIRMEDAERALADEKITSKP